MHENKEAKTILLWRHGKCKTSVFKLKYPDVLKLREDIYELAK